MKQFIAHVFTKAGDLVHSAAIIAFTHAQARQKAHEQFGSAESLAERDTEVWVIPT